MKYLLTLAALTLALACTKKPEAAPEVMAPETSNSAPVGADSAAAGAAQTTSSSSASAQPVRAEEDNKVVKDKSGKAVKDAPQSSSSQPGK